jgi:hypothetical protein
MAAPSYQPPPLSPRIGGMPSSTPTYSPATLDSYATAPPASAYSPTPIGFTRVPGGYSAASVAAAPLSAAATGTYSPPVRAFIPSANVDVVKAFGDAAWQNRFWLQVLSDHAQMIVDGLASSDAALIESFRELKRRIDAELTTVNEGRSDSARISAVAQQSVIMKKMLLATILEGKTASHISPSTLNHKLNKEEAYLAILAMFASGQPITISPTMQHKLWLSSAASHAKGLAKALDATEVSKRMKLIMLAKKFKSLSMRAHEFHGFTRSGLRDFPALGRLTEDAHDAIVFFIHLLEKLLEMKRAGSLLTTSNDLDYLHAIREYTYYLQGLAYTYQRPELASTDIEAVIAKKKMMHHMM